MMIAIVRYDRRAGISVTLKRLAPELVLFLHFAFVLFAILGGFLALRDLRWMWIHVPVVLWSSVVNFANWTCPLTPLEKSLRTKAGGTEYEGGFVTHYIGPLVYPGGMPRRLELTAAISILVWNVIAYAIVFSLR